MNGLSQLQNLLRDLFQLELADLDFGLYRLLHLKRQEVEGFLTEQLPHMVEQAFESAAGEERTFLEEEVSRLAARIKEEIAADALLPNGDVKSEFHDIPARAARNLIANYEAKRQQLQSVQAGEAQKVEVFNHLYAFFSRYYEAGDFIPRRRYGARETYAVPYNGEETFFHWANKDQHYVKTGEAFRDYAFAVEVLGGPFRVRFVLTEASLPPGNIKGDTRYFFPLPDQATWDEESRVLRLPLHYRLPTEKEIGQHGKSSKLQESILQGAVPKILDAVRDPALHAALSATVEENGDQAISLLFKRLRHFTRRNTTDYFIHRDLERFLKGEIEFYLKDQVLHLSDIEGDIQGKLRTLRVIRQLAEEVIKFLAQMENVQKRLFEKRKFVLWTDYLVPLKEVPRELWKEVLANKVQIQAWRTLFAIEPRKDLLNKGGKVTKQFLEEHPTLVVDTAHFGPEFKERLLAAFDDLDEATDGLLIHAENYQALRFLERKYAGKVKCIYIDPPYNTGNDGFIYKDRYRHSSWLAMMEQRLQLSAKLLHQDAIVLVSCDDNELERLKLRLSINSNLSGFKGTLVWKSRNFTDARPTTGISLDHEYILASGAGPTARFRGKEKDISKYSNPDSDPRGPWTSCSLLGKATQSQRPNLHYEFENPDTSEIYRCPANTGWICAKDTMLTYIKEKRIIWPRKPGGRPRLKVFLKELKSEFMGFPSVIDDVFTSEGTMELRDLFGAQIYTFPKPPELLKTLIEQCTELGSIVLDYFSGSGTTGHAAIDLNREDGGRRKFILVEMADYFDTVLVPRIQKVMYAPEWKDGKPKRLPTQEEVERTPRLVKVLRLEGYEDALHNLSTDETLKKEVPRANAHKEMLGGDTYRLSYLVRLPLEASASMLNLAALEHPFRYTIEVLSADGPRVETVDLVETFNGIYGLHVERLETWVNDEDKRSYRVVKGRDRDRHRVLALWRDMEGLDPAMERRFLEEKLKAEGPFDEKLINGDTATPGIRSLDGLFKRLLEEGEG
ncbi:MAG: site-specific DNA-methyltransferase [Deltaproteobacteria bacterium]|nr:site-specific DNA-methyltransferase [Deltaproteobacteria bacterium]